MQNYTEYSYKLRPDQLEKIARDAATIGAEVYMIINGEYYEVETDTSTAEKETKNNG